MRDVIPGDLLQQLRSDGFARLPNVIGTRELQGLRRAVAELVTARPSPFYRTGFDFEHGGRAADGTAVNGDALYRVKYSLDKHRRFLALLGHPLVLSYAASIIAEPFIVCWEDLLVKEAGEPFGVPWHQDAESGGEGVYTIGVYIVGSGDNPLRVVPGSHKMGVLSPEALVETAREYEAEAVAVEADAGDIVIHNNNILHQSGPCGSASRYTVFFEFRSVRMVERMPDWGRSFVKARQHFIAAGVRARRSFADLVCEDEERHLSSAPFQDLWDLGEELPPEAEINLRVSQSPERWCLSPTPEHRRRAVAAYVAGEEIQSAASRFGVSEEALFKWLCEAGVFTPNERGRYMEESSVSPA